METGTYHKSVLVDEVVAYLNPQPGAIYVDATLGGGGHTRAILRHEPGCTVIGIDWDQKALELNAPLLEAEFPGHFYSIWGNFAQLPLLLNKKKIRCVNGILADFGTSQYQITEQPGFSFAHDKPLDMRMSPAHQRDTAYTIINKATEAELVHIFTFYGQEPHARRIARALIEARRSRPLKTTADLAKMVEETVPHKFYHKIHPATRVFQALRIVVNKELENIEALLINSTKVLAPHGRLVCISFHSLEDRIVKHFLREHKHEFSLLTSRAVTPTSQEIAENPSSRSARLRAAEYMGGL